jgi:hypothetical protein
MNSLEYNMSASQEDSSEGTFRRQQWRIRRVLPVRPVEALVVAILALWLLIVAWEEEGTPRMAVDIVLEPTSSTKTTGVVLDKKKPMGLLDERGDKPVKEDHPSSSSQTSEKTLPAPNSSSCDYDCQTDRLGHMTPLYSGQAICNHEYRFGLSSRDGTTSLRWHNCDSGDIVALYSTNKKQEDTVYFELQEDATFQIRSGSKEILWEKPSTRKIHATPECLQDPDLDCPYLHLHKHGNVVLNWINDDNGEWMDRNIQRCYKDFDVLGD